MSDSTATAREPSMEDILASIRRIIDEEDTRDARPASDLPVDDAGAGDGADADLGTPPVMAAATVERGDAPRESAGEPDGATDGTGDDDGSRGDAIFPERESLFWSRATGRGESAAERDEPGGDDAEAPAEPRTDIFRRAQSKLGSGARPGPRERIQSLAARAGERAESAAHERGSLAELEELSDRAENDAAEEMRGDAASTVAAIADAGDAADAGSVGDRDAASYPELDDSDVLDLTEPLRHPDSSDDAREDASRFDGLSDDEDRMDIAQGRRHDADAAPPADDPESLRGMAVSGEGMRGAGEEAGASADDGPETAPDADDVLDLTTPLYGEAGTVESGSVESGDSFHVSGVEEEEAVADAPYDDALYDDAREDDAPEEGGHDDTPANTYSRFDSEPEARTDREPQPAPAGAAANEPVSEDAPSFGGVRDAFEPHEPDGDVSDAGADEAARDAPPAFMQAGDNDDDDDNDGDDDPYAAAFTMIDDRPPSGADSPSPVEGEADGPDRLDDLDMGDELGFSDTFSASDVYHDDPPELDEDYSRSFEVEDEPVAARAAHPDDEVPRPDDPRDDGMEKVGGLVRDAMERDPVDYADPSALVSMTSEEISARALASLADVEGEATRRVFGSLRISDDDGSESLEGMVRGMLRPLLREWLDDNLPGMVEAAVRGEVERISAKSRKYSRAADRD